MTTLSWTSNYDHTNDATFRVWGEELEDKLTLAGLVQTADTGQIDWTTATRSAINTFTSGYSIWTFDDTQQSTAPIYLKIEYGTGSTNTFPKIRITVGTGSNGTGTLTGTALTAARNINGNTTGGTTNRQSFLCVTDGFMGLMHKTDSGAEGAFFICRTSDSSGTPNATGALVSWGGNASGVGMSRQSLRFAATAAAYTATATDVTAALGLNPQAPLNTSVDTDIQVAIGFTITPRAEPLFGVCGVAAHELNPKTTFKAILVGTIPRTFITMNSSAGPFTPISISDTGAMRVAMLWE
jgi:hypothetical protein